MLVNNFDYEKSKAVPLPARFPFMEWKMHFNRSKGLAYYEELRTSADAKQRAFAKQLKSGAASLWKLPSPRFIKSHLPLSLLPPALLDTCKVLHVARDPRDVAVSFYYHHKFFHKMEFHGDFKEFWSLFINDQLIWSLFFENVKEAWEKHNHPNMLFLFYSEIVKDLPATVRRVADFLGKPVAEEQLGPLCEHLSIDSFKKNKSLNFDFLKDIQFIAKDRSFVRKGKSGGWREHFDEEMTRQAARWIEDQLKDSDFRFPTDSMFRD